MENVYFSGWWDIHNGRLSRTGTGNYFRKSLFFASGRALYGDWGRFGNIAVDENLNVHTQYNIENPLSYKSDAFYYIKQGEIHVPDENPHLFIVKRKEMISTFNYFRNNVERNATVLKKRHGKDMENFMDLVNCENSSLKILHKKSEFTPASLQYLVDKKSDLLFRGTAEQATKLSSPIYAGGCIKTVRLEQMTYVIYCDGINLSRLTVNRLNLKNNTLERTQIYQHEIEMKNQPIFQIDTVGFEEYINVAVRFMDCIAVLKIFILKDKLIIENVVSINSMDQFISCKLGRNWSREFVGTFSDKIHVYDSQTKENLWCKDTTNYSSVIDKWNEIQSTNIPKTWLFTDRSNSYFYDTRINPFTSGVELFNTRVDSLSRNESFYHATNIFNENYYYLFSTFNGILVDIRSPLIAVNQWTMPSMSPCSYSSVDILPNTDRINVTVGCQLDAKHMVFHQHMHSNSKSTALSSKSCFPIDTIMSLGLASHFSEQSNVLSVLTLDHQANIFGNQYKLNDDIYNYHSILSENVANNYNYRSTNRFKESTETHKPLQSYEFGMDYLSEVKLMNVDGDYEMLERALGMHDEESKSKKEM